MTNTNDWFTLAVALGTLIAEIGVVMALLPERRLGSKQLAEHEERIRLNIESFDPRSITQPVFGLDDLTDAVPDLIDRARNPEAFAKIDVGNEILIVGPEQSGKKALALHIAKLADISRVIVVYNPRDADVLARAKKMIENRTGMFFRRSTPRHEKTMLLLPGLDPANGNRGEAWCDQLEALIETASSLPHVLVVGTVRHYERSGEVASWFGTVLPLPEEASAAWNEMIKQIAEGFLDNALRANYRLVEMDHWAFTSRILDVAPNPAEVKDIFAQCRTLATHNLRQDKSKDLLLTSDILETAIERVIPASPSS